MKDHKFNKSWTNTMMLKAERGYKARLNTDKNGQNEQKR